MRYSLITSIIAIVWIAMLIICANFPDIATSVYYLTMVSTIIIFYIGFQMKTK